MVSLYITTSSSYPKVNKGGKLSMAKKPVLSIIIETPNHNFLEALAVYQQVLNIDGEKYPFRIEQAHFGEEIIYSVVSELESK